MVKGSGTGFSKSAPGQGVEVRFEWKRGSRKTGSKKREKDKRKEPSASAAGHDDDEGGMPSPMSDSHLGQQSRRRKRLSTTSIGRQSVSTVLTSEDGNHGVDAAGEDSDPEDSEMPWSCVLKIRRHDEEVQVEETSSRSRWRH
jgi:hypothetical protein